MPHCDPTKDTPNLITQPKMLISIEGLLGDLYSPMNHKHVMCSKLILSTTFVCPQPLDAIKATEHIVSENIDAGTTY